MKTMKKTLIISAFAAALLTTGCVSNEAFSPEEKQVEICFATPVVGSLTKAPVYGEIGPTYPTSENFTIFGVRHASTYDGWASTNAVSYINGAEFKYYDRYNDATTGTGGWKALNKKYYWPMSGVLSFGGYSPSSAHATDPGNGKGEFSYNENGVQIANFTVNPNVAEQQDIMYAKRTYNKTTNAGGVNEIYDGVDIEFAHALSAIKFTAQLDGEYESKFTVTSITIGGVKGKGDFNEKVVDKYNDDEVTYSSSPSWAVEGSNTTYNVFSGTAELSETSQTVAENIILLPQTMTEAAYITIKYKVGDVNTAEELESTVMIEDLTSEWVMGTRYTYNITLGYDLIYVGATVDRWETEQDVNIPIN